MSTPIPTSTRKRKRDEEKILLGEPFVVQPHSASLFETPIRLTPAVLIPRSYIPLQWLTGIPPRLFSAHLPSLEVVGNVLIAKTDGERQLYAVEQISGGAFTLSKLSSTVKLKDVRKIASLARKSKSVTVDLESESRCLNKDWWVDLLMDNLPENMLLTSNDSLVFSMCKGRKERRSMDKLTNQEPLLLTPQLEFRDPTPAEILEQTRAQYYETLYLAKTSIAYFAKSTLSRVRVIFQDSSAQSAQSPTQLIEFLQSMLIPLDKMDSKFKKALIQSAMEEVLEDKTVYREHEEEYIQRWIATTFGDKMIRVMDPKLKQQVEDLKIRETELQIILLLEILALKSKSQSREEEHESQGKKKYKDKKKKYKKKSPSCSAPDPEVLLDLLIDRLCIWRSIGSMADVDKTKTKKPKDEDRLRHFCVEVIMAFYGSRLPERCASIQKKCGAAVPAPVDKTPAKKSVRKRPKVEAKPASLYRSTTAPAAMAAAESKPRATSAGLSEKLISERSPADINAVAARKLQKRAVEVPKLKPKSATTSSTTVEEELKDAIKALAKPNRLAAGVQQMEEKTRRLSRSSSGSIKKTKKPLRKSFGNRNSVQVMATPSKKGLFKSVVKATLPLAEYSDDDEGHTLPSLFRDNNSPIHLTSRISSTSNQFSKLSALHSVPESSPVQTIPFTPRKPSTFESTYPQSCSLIEVDVVVGSSPITVSRRKLSRAATLSFPPKSRGDLVHLNAGSCSNPPSPSLDTAKLICGTPIKKRKVEMHANLYEDNNDFASPYGGQPCGGVSLRSVNTMNGRRHSGSGASKSFGLQLSENMGPGTGISSKTCEFGNIDFRVGESPVKPKKWNSWGKQVGEASYLLSTSPGAIRTKSRPQTASGLIGENSLTPPSSQPPPTPTFPPFEIPEKGVSIYENLGWDDEDPLL